MCSILPVLGSHASGDQRQISFSGRENSNLVNGKLKQGIPPPQFYDLETDLAQTTKVYIDHPGVVEVLAAILAKHRGLAPAPKKGKRQKEGQES